MKLMVDDAQTNIVSKGQQIALEDTVSSHNIPSPAQSKPPHNKKPLIIIAIVVAIVMLGLGIWRLVLIGQEPTQSSNTPVFTQKQKDKGNDVPLTTQTKDYENGFLGINLTYPSNWKLVESNNQDGVRLESPDFGYETTDKGRVMGNFRVYIRKGARETDSKYIGRGIAIKPSEKLTYARPTPSQRTETLLSFFGLDSTDNFAFFLIAGNFQLNIDESLGPTYGRESETYIIAGGYSASDLTDDLATNTVPTTNYDQTNAYKQAIDIIKSLQLH